MEYGVLLEIVRNARMASGMSQKAICEKLGKDRSYVIKVESGQRRLDMVEFFQLFRAMGIDPLPAVLEFAGRTFHSP